MRTDLRSEARNRSVNGTPMTVPGTKTIQDQTRNVRAEGSWRLIRSSPHAREHDSGDAERERDEDRECAHDEGEHGALAGELALGGGAPRLPEIQRGGLRHVQTVGAPNGSGWSFRDIAGAHTAAMRAA